MTRWVVAVGLGLLTGVATARADLVAGQIEQDSLSRAIAMVLNAGSVWAGLAVLAGWVVIQPRRAAVAGLAALGAAVLGYYAFGVTLGDRSHIGLGAVSGVVRLWAVIAVVAGPVLGFAGASIRRSGLAGLLATLVVPVGVVVEMIGLRRFGPETFAVDPALAWAQLAMIAAAAAGAGAAVLLRFRRATGHSSPGRRSSNWEGSR